ncbi:hypothetical protein [Trebonia kvetii]|uniref:hypothetical protein n=1 Tax=Trebonia kvetii TaxID=2480626 RepID=UPI00165205F6|nr:hypothetical protein [Trebonia kvetii]
MRWFRRWYGANPLHLLVMLGCVMLTGYAGAALLQVKAVGVLIWFGGAVVGHDLILVPLYVLADRSVMTVFRHRPPKLPTVPWINYLRVPAALSGMLLLIWFPLIFRIPSRFPRTTDLSLNPYLGHWLAVTGVLFLLSAAAFALRLRPGRRRRETASHRRGETASHRRGETAGHRRDENAGRRAATSAPRLTGPNPNVPAADPADAHRPRGYEARRPLA